MRSLPFLLILCFPFCEESTVFKTATLLKSGFSGETANLKPLFSQSFLQAVPFEKISEIFADLSQKYGSIQKIQTVEKISDWQAQFQFLFESATMPVNLNLDTKNKITGLWFGTPTLSKDSKEKILQDLSDLPGLCGLCLMGESGQILIQKNADENFALGSVFKLYVLGRQTLP